MKQTIIDLPADTFISDIEPFKSNGIPSNSIIHKQVTGCGITTFEIQYALHNSIIILPNVPVIESKVKKHNVKYPEAAILGVHKGVDVNDIKAYLLKDIKYKKILTTPEGFMDKVLKAFEKDSEVMYNQYFLLYDECERIITDISYRGKIAAPLDIFFDFTNKALVSATTLEFSDTRFSTFNHYLIKPTYEYNKPLTVVNTNNVLASLKTHLDQLQSEHVCIFFNSTNGIYALTETLDIKAKSKAFCSQESVVKLMERKYMNASSEFESKDMSSYTLFTSRYFSAIDIELDYKPDVIMISDIFFANHSILDPHTEVIQIAGRFRNGISSLTHISNFNPAMETMSPQEAKIYLNGCLDTYEHIIELFSKANNNPAKDTLKFFVEYSPIASFYTNGKRNSFMIDNDLNEERVKGYYTSIDNLKVAYNDVSAHFVMDYIDEEYPVGDSDFYVLANSQTKYERYKQVALLIHKYTAKPGGFIFLSDAAKHQRSILVERYPLIAQAYNLIGLKGLEAANYQSELIKIGIKNATKLNEIIKLAPHVHAAFAEDSIVPQDVVIVKLKAIYQEHHIKYKAYATHIERYFKARRTTHERNNVYALDSRIYAPPIQKF